MIPGLVLALAAWGITANFMPGGRGLSADSADALSESEQLAHRLALAKTALAERGEQIAQLRAEQARLSHELETARKAHAAAEKSAGELQQRLVVTTGEAVEAREQVAQLQRLLAERQGELERQRQQLAALEKGQTEARKQIEGLTMAVVVAEQEKKALRATAESLRQELATERTEGQGVQPAMPTAPPPGLR